MKRALIIIGLIVALIAITITYLGFYFVHTPEYALIKIVDDINESGIDGLRPHLTEDALEAVDMVSKITESKLVGTIIGLINKDDDVSILKFEIQEVQWDVKDIMKSSDNATVILAFNYDNRLIGSIELSMIREGDVWKIDDLEFPEFDEFNW